MVDKDKKVTQLAERIDLRSAVTLTDKQKLSLYKKSQKSGYPIDILEEVYNRGIESWNEETNKTPEQYAFGRVNSFIAGGKAMELDEDLLNESTEALKKKSANSGISVSILRQVYKRGVAAWRTGHRPGTTPQQWGMARVNSFITGGKTRRTADKDLWARHKGNSVKEEFDLEEMADRYKTGDSKTDAKRKAHFEKGKNMDDNDPKAYRDAPGDKEARKAGVPESKYTKKYREMYNEQALVLTNPVTPGQPQPLMLSPGARVDNARSPFTRSLPRSVPGKSVVLPDVKSTMQGAVTRTTPPSAPRSSISNDQLRAALDRGRRAMNINIAPQAANRSIASRIGSALTKTFLQGPLATGLASVKYAITPTIANQDSGYEQTGGGEAPEGSAEWQARREEDIRREQERQTNMTNATPDAEMNMKVGGNISGRNAGRRTRNVREEVENAEKISKNPNDPSSRFMGSDELVNVYKQSTPGQCSAVTKVVKDIVKETLENMEEEATSVAQRRLMAMALQYKKGNMKGASSKVKKLADSMTVKQLEDYAKTKEKGLPEKIEEATYKGKKVTLNKPFRTPGGPKKSAVYVDPDGDGKAKIVRFGDPNMSIKKDRPARKKSYCARSAGQGNTKDKGSANYWSRKAWDC